MTQDESLELHRLMVPREPRDYIEAANAAVRMAGLTDDVKTYKQAMEYLYALYISLLDAGATTEAALLIWGADEIFDPRPISVQRIWKALDTHSKILIPGGGDQGKSYTPSAWTVLWWSHDPQWTSVKVLSVTSEHAAMNVMATIKTFHEMSVLPLPGRRMEKFIDLEDGNKRASIAMAPIPQGEDLKGRLRGFHPMLRPVPHPVFGRKSRIGVFVDEFEDVPVGIFEGLDNILSSETDDGIHIKIYGGANPKKRESPFAQRCEFPGGWQNFNIDTSLEWKGPEVLGSWNVIRLDPAQSENVKQKQEIFHGMMTYQGYMNYMRKGTSSPEYYTFGRGAWPESTAEFRVTPADYFNNCRGVLTFESDVVSIASLDPAFSEGGDGAVLTTGRYGTAIGFSPIGGGYTRINPRKCIQIEQQFPIPKSNTLTMAQHIMSLLRRLGVRPEWFIMDRTGNGHGLCDALMMQYGDIIGQQWAEAATDRKIIEEDSLPASEVYSGVVSEMAFAFARWLEFGYIKFAPLMDISKIINQATNRKYSYRGKFMIVQSKSDYKRTTNAGSPDEYDSLIMTTHLVRLRESVKAVMVAPENVRKEMKVELRDSTDYGPTGKMEFYDLTNI